MNITTGSGQKKNLIHIYIYIFFLQFSFFPIGNAALSDQKKNTSTIEKALVEEAAAGTYRQRHLAANGQQMAR